MLKTHKYWLGLFWLVTIFVLPLPLIQTLAQGLDGTINQYTLFASQIGTIAYTWMLFAIAVSEKPKWLDRLIGLPEMYFAHGIIGVGAIVLAFGHKMMLQSTGMIKLTGNLALILFILVAGYSMFFMSGLLTSKIKLMQAFKARLEKIFRYETSVWIHRLNIVATLLVFAHVILIPYIRVISGFMFYFYLYSGVTAGVYFYMHAIKPRLFRKGILLARRQLADSVTELVIQLKRRGNFRSGDFVYFNFPQIDGMKEMHPFSILQYDKRKHQLVFTIRNWGDFTAKLDQVPLGAQVRVDGSYGRLLDAVKEHGEENLFFIGSGVGSVPLISLVSALVHRRKITFVRVVSQKEDLVYEAYLRQLEREYSNFTYYSQLGRLSQIQVDKFAQDSTFYLVGGSPAMMDGTMKMLKKSGVKRKYIYGEKFNF
jgi:predicted ferric reductase